MCVCVRDWWEAADKDELFGISLQFELNSPPMTNSAVNPNPRTFNQEVFSFWPALPSFCYLSLSFRAHLANESGQHCQIWVKAVEHEKDQVLSTQTSTVKVRQKIS